MGHKLRFGVLTMQDGGWSEMVQRWQYVEEAGFDSIWLADHFVNYVRPQDPWFEAWTLLPALALKTSRVRIGTLVTPFTWRNPAFLARQTMTLDHVSGGRLNIGLGAGAPGSMDCSFAMTGTPDYPPGERVGRFREVVEILDHMLINPLTNYEGRYYKLQGAAMAPMPVQKPRPPITIGAMGPRMLRVAAEYADTWNSFGSYGWEDSPQQVLEATRQRNDLLDVYCLEIGRDPVSLRRSLLLYGQEAENAFSSQSGFQQIVDRYMEIGISEFIIYYPFLEEHYSAFEHIAREGIPAVRESRS